MSEQQVKSVATDELRIAYVEYGSIEGWPVILSHGFPYDVHAFDEVGSILVRAGQESSFPMPAGSVPPNSCRTPLCELGSKRPAAGTSSSSQTR